jgi:hypothetical protein
MYLIEVDNPIRGINGRIEYRWYADTVTRFEASLVKSAPAKDKTIKIYVNGNLKLETYNKQDALGMLRTLINKAPPLCNEEFENHSDYLYQAILAEKFKF